MVEQGNQTLIWFPCTNPSRSNIVCFKWDEEITKHLSWLLLAVEAVYLVQKGPWVIDSAEPKVPSTFRELQDGPGGVWIGSLYMLRYSHNLLTQKFISKEKLRGPVWCNWCLLLMLAFNIASFNFLRMFCSFEKRASGDKNLWHTCLQRLSCRVLKKVPVHQCVLDLLCTV